MVSSDTVIKTILFGLGGVVVGGLRHLTGSYIGDTVEDIDLSVPYVHIQEDPLLLDILYSIRDQFSQIDKVAFIRTIKNVDSLVGLNTTLCKRVRNVNLDDRTNAIDYFRRSKLSIQRFITRAEVVLQAREVIQLQRNVQKLMKQIEFHLQSIVIQTRDIYIHP